MSESLIMHNIRRLSALGAALAVVSAGMTQSAEASYTLAYEEVPQFCPPAESIQSSQDLSPTCRSFLMSTLRESVYDDVRDSLAVATYQKVAGISSVTGTIGPETARNILSGNALDVSSPASDIHKGIHIDKSEQAAYTINNGVLEHVFSVSTGTERPYKTWSRKAHRYVKGFAHTPIGRFKIGRQEGPNYQSGAGLGPMPYAKFFTTNGHAIHTGNVDNNGRDSHGCVRFDSAVMKQYIVNLYGRGNIIQIVE